ncbi:rod shape-determining protein MreD [Sporolactobacillus sp. CPB3-1]|uniref:Rod shape-determining protein MreD n=1 Tax=Sporolactobacillus mangiferae TaxID=2940498 RepID=A0ABT0M6M1_9BACL|nr:rod shape-determining protein MreD [Sporolactobacillus mangiferae]MCL1630512.1 rod shape-determining protein MreD [Sporolactobacillus mangiferae]
MKQSKIFILLLFLFLIQGTVMPLLPFSDAWGKVQPVSEFVFVALILTSFFGSLSLSLRYALIFGFLTDIVYSSILGVYAFCFGVTVYLVHALSKWVNLNAVMTVLLVSLGICMVQAEIYLIYSMIGIAKQQIEFFFQYHLLPTIGLNALFTLLLYYPYKRLLEKIADAIEK